MPIVCYLEELKKIETEINLNSFKSLYSKSVGLTLSKWNDKKNSKLGYQMMSIHFMKTFHTKRHLQKQIIVFWNLN